MGGSLPLLYSQYAAKTANATSYSVEIVAKIEKVATVRSGLRLKGQMAVVAKKTAAARAAVERKRS